MCWPPKPVESHASYFHVKISYFLLFVSDLLIFLKTNPTHTFSFLPLLMTVASHEPLQPDHYLCKDILDYRRKYTIFSEISEFSVTGSMFLPSPGTCKLAPWAMARGAGWASSAPQQSSPPVPTSSSCSALGNQSSWKLMPEAEGAVLPSLVNVLILFTTQPQRLELAWDEA